MTIRGYLATNPIERNATRRGADEWKLHVNGEPVTILTEENSNQALALHGIAHKRRLDIIDAKVVERFINKKIIS